MLLFFMLSFPEDYSREVDGSIRFNYHQRADKIHLLYIYNEISFQYTKLLKRIFYFGIDAFSYSTF